MIVLITLSYRISDVNRVVKTTLMLYDMDLVSDPEKQSVGFTVIIMSDVSG